MLQIMDFSTDKGEPEESEISSLSKSEEDVYSLRSWMKKRENLFRLRGERVERVCEKFNVSLITSSSSITDYINKQTKMDKVHFVERISLDQFSLSRPHRTMGCLINKVASTSFNKALLFLDGFPVRNITSPHAFKSKLNPKNEEELKFAEKHFTKFMIVREPMERLASCYLDKAVTNTHWSLGAFRKGLEKSAYQKD
ncbi:uncharacterized protein LOC111711329 [Eurytemora carolleeae]|uniref:uncharacterized protein LOC111711329 n=1 Tax=Eurytemora carolleeae TaxID=1294199 RepID=UPI000C77DB59|nr:uncharacterized protein LOC111711329 [Eurytemora carolleeae]|eukprot:XP_023341430.1 uncharacterized protein LOC111711329 [Eurytemora affinis]